MDRIDDGLIQSAANANGKGKRIVLVGFVAALLAALTVAAVAVGIAMTGKTNAPLPPETEIETNAETEEQTTEKTVISVEDNKADYVVLQNAIDDMAIYEAKPSADLPYFKITPYDIIDEELFDNSQLVYNPSSFMEKLGLYDMIGKKHSNICEIGIKFRGYIEQGSDKNCEKWVVCIIPNENIEILSENNYFYFQSDKDNDYDEQDIRLQYTYKDGKTNGYVKIYVYRGEERIKYFEENLKENIRNTTEEIYKTTNGNKIGFACVKGYDYWGKNVDEIYRNVAVYYGDVDDLGRPLYRTDFYMPDYYDCPICVTGREELEKIQNIFQTDKISDNTAE